MSMQLDSVCAVALSVVAIVAGVSLDLCHVNARCSPLNCNWSARAGAVVAVCGTYLAFRSAAVLITRRQKILQTDPDTSFQYGKLSFMLIAGGTLLWAFGDLIRF
jgi:hypothetical protein